ncbi:MAG: NUDIX domain-containing protein [Anaerolineae bacterium]
MIQFNGPDELGTWLMGAGIDVSVWGTGGRKRVADLWRELVTGDCVLETEPPRRVVRVAQIIIRRGSNVLVEAEQVLEDGQQRSRHVLPSEKMKPGEPFADAALRCLCEEMGVHAEDVHFLGATYQRRERLADSRSYPGLPACYVIHSIEAQVAGLPDTDFWRDNAAYPEGDPVQRHRWAWRSGTGVIQ